MCIMIAKPRGILPPVPSALINCIKANPDGCGVAYVENRQIVIRKGLWSADRFVDEVLAVGRKPAIIHCRLATTGSIKRSNCHPFLLKNGVAMAHNGVIAIKTKGDMTDSETFGKNYLERVDATLLRNPDFQEYVGSVIGYSKIALLYKTGRIDIINAELGCEEDGLWYSNTSYKTPPPNKKVYVWESEYNRLYRPDTVHNRYCDYRCSLCFSAHDCVDSDFYGDVSAVS